MRTVDRGTNVYIDRIRWQEKLPFGQWNLRSVQVSSAFPVF